MFLPEKDIRRRNRWYFGGLSSTIITMLTHPLDLMKVHLQTQQEVKLGIAQIIANIYRKRGILGFYDGLSASLLRQMTYTTTRFGIYEGGKGALGQTTLRTQIALGILAGLIGGTIGVPMDMVNVRMQNDMKLEPDKRRNYKHVFDGLIRVAREEGMVSLFTGGSLAVCRGVVITLASNVVYDQARLVFESYEMFTDGAALHFSSSLVASATATLCSQPLDVLKTRKMNAKPGEFTSIWQIIVYTAKVGPGGFFKGLVPAFVRIAPQTILTFMLMEQFRLRFGYYLPGVK